MLLIANWKQNKTYDDLQKWVAEFKNHVAMASLQNNNNIEVIIAPPFPFLYPLTNILNETSISLASQDISPYSDGPHTGEVGPKQIKGTAKYVIIGHSERRAMGESAKTVNMKLQNTLANGLVPILCFSSISEFNDIDIEDKSGILFAYEPLGAIGSGKPASIEDIEKMQAQVNLEKLIYGGSVDKISVQDYLKLNFINGFLVGTASLQSDKFGELVNILLS